DCHNDSAQTAKEHGVYNDPDHSHAPHLAASLREAWTCRPGLVRGQKVATGMCRFWRKHFSSQSGRFTTRPPTSSAGQSRSFIGSTILGQGGHKVVTASPCQHYPPVRDSKNGMTADATTTATTAPPRRS